MDNTKMIKDLKEIIKATRSMDEEVECDELADALKKIGNTVNTNDKVYDKFRSIIDDNNIVNPDDEGDLLLNSAYAKGFTQCADAGGGIFNAIAKLAEFDERSYVVDSGKELSGNWRYLNPTDIKQIANALILKLEK